MSLQLLNEINSNYHMAVAVHRELADIFFFIGLEGYSTWHEYQRESESLEQRKVKRYMDSTYHIFAPDRLPKTANITEPLLEGKNRKTLKPEQTWSILKEAFHIYQGWEESTLQKYQRISKELFDSGEVPTSNFVNKLTEGVKIELDYLTNKLIELNAMGWDMPQIVGEQPDYVERYEYLIRNLLGKSPEYHHYNSSLDAISRKSVLDKYPD